MGTLIVLFALFIVFDIAAWYLGSDSTRHMNGREWRCSERWYGTGHDQMECN